MPFNALVCLLIPLFQQLVQATNQENIDQLEKLPVTAIAKNIENGIGDYIAAASAFNINQTDPKSLMGIPPSGKLNYELFGHDYIAAAELGNFYGINSGYARYLQGENVNAGTCEIPNSKYEDWVAFLSPDFIVPDKEASLCEPNYCIQVIYGTRAVNLKINGAALDTSYYDVAVSRHVFEELTVPTLQVIRVTWSLVDCENHPLGATFID
jgi:hypothetical protein